MLQRWKILLAVGMGVVLVPIGWLYVPLDRAMFAPDRSLSIRITDRHGTLLREVLSEQEGRGRWCSLSDVSPHLVNAVLAAEDVRFFRHPGVDLRALLRAAWQNLSAGRIVSGGSTITMQLMRNVMPVPRTLWSKIREAWLALRLEQMMSKEEILVQYLNRIPFGNQTVGADAAARVYFAKPAAQLSPAEAAFLASLPNAPTQNDPYRNVQAARRRQLHILARMEAAGFLSPEERERAQQEPLALVPRTSGFKAPHFTTMIMQRLTPEARSGIEEIRTTLDFSIQQTAERLVRSHLARLRKHDVTNAAMMVVDNASHEVVALVGSRDFFDTTLHGQVNGALALRQPGSTLKPFVYGIALERGMTAADVLPDIPDIRGNVKVDFLPENYDRKYHGPVRLRMALACSYNVPAVRTLELFGEELLLRTLQAAGFTSLDRPSSHYGLGLALGNGEVTLFELAGAYSALANGGLYVPLTLIRHVRRTGGFEHAVLHLWPGTTAESVRVFSPQVAYLLTDMLADAQARAPAFGVHSSLNLPFPCAAKTGTSKDYRDNWTVGYTPRYTVAVWVGNFSGRPMRLVSGITGAAPLFRDMMLFLHQGETLPFVRPAGLLAQRICPRSGMRPGRYCPGEVTELFVVGTAPTQTCSVHHMIRLDSRNGFRASDATPQEFIIDKVFEILPSIYDRWMEKEGLTRPPAEVSTAEVASSRTIIRGTLSIRSPVSGEVFKLDPILRSQYQTFVVESDVPDGVEAVTLYVDGKAVASLAPPYRVRLPLTSLQKGAVTLQVRGREKTRVVQSQPVVIAVR